MSEIRAAEQELTSATDTANKPTHTNTACAPLHASLLLSAPLCAVNDVDDGIRDIQFALWMDFDWLLAWSTVSVSPHFLGFHEDTFSCA